MEWRDETNHGDLTRRDFIKTAGTGLIASRLDTPSLAKETAAPSESVRATGAEFPPATNFTNLYLFA